MGPVEMSLLLSIQEMNATVRQMGRKNKRAGALDCEDDLTLKNHGCRAHNEFISFSSIVEQEVNVLIP